LAQATVAQAPAVGASDPTGLARRSTLGPSLPDLCCAMAGISTYAAVPPGPGGLRNKARGGRSFAAAGESPEPPLYSTSLVQTKREALRVKHGNAVSGRSPSDLLGAASPSGLRTPRAAPPGNLAGLVRLFWDPISLLLVAWPLGCLAHFHDWGDIPEFWLNFLAMVPLAKILGDATEELAAGLKNDTLGGLLNATFGNAVEMILTVQTLRAGQIGVVKGTLLGSILSNLLLVLGMSFFVGGLTPSKGSRIGKEQTFSTQAALTNMTMLLLACSAFAFPAVFFSQDEIGREYMESQISELGTFAAGSTPRLLQISRWCSVYILAAYVAFLFFQLYTHADVFKGGSDDEEEEEEEELDWLRPCPSPRQPDPPRAQTARVPQTARRSRAASCPSRARPAPRPGGTAWSRSRHGRRRGPREAPHCSAARRQGPWWIRSRSTPSWRCA